VPLPNRSGPLGIADPEHAEQLEQVPDIQERDVLAHVAGRLGPPEQLRSSRPTSAASIPSTSWAFT